MSPAREYRVFVGRQVLAVIEGFSFRGTLTDATPAALALADVEMQPDAGEWLQMTGEVVIERARVLWVQVV